MLVCNGICAVIYHSKYIRIPLLHQCTSVQLLQCIHNHGGCAEGKSGKFKQEWQSEKVSFVPIQCTLKKRNNKHYIERIINKDNNNLLISIVSQATHNADWVFNKDNRRHKEFHVTWKHQTRISVIVYQAPWSS